MTEITQILAAIKRQLKVQGKTYKDVADALKLSEQSIKRMLGSGRLPLDRVIQLSNLLGFTLAELTQEANLSDSRLSMLSEAQEKELVADTQLLLVAICVLNHWTMADILSTYRLSEAKCLQKLLHLDRLRMIDLLPGNRIRLNIARDFEWIPTGPLRQHFVNQGLTDFLDSPFTHSDEALTFTHAMLTEASAIKMQKELARLRQKFSELHVESLSAPLKRRHGTGLLLVMREWEPVEFTKLKR